MRANNNGDMKTNERKAVGTVQQTVYLGGLLSTEAAAKPEVTRRLGEARGNCRALAQCWAHANIRRAHRIHINMATVELIPKTSLS